MAWRSNPEAMKKMEAYWASSGFKNAVNRNVQKLIREREMDKANFPDEEYPSDALFRENEEDELTLEYWNQIKYQFDSRQYDAKVQPGKYFT